MMTRRILTLALFGALASGTGARAQDPTPTPAASPVVIVKRPLATPETPTPTTGTTGSSLADVVRRSQEARGESKRSLGVITNETLKQPGAGTTKKGGTVNVVATPKPGTAPAAAAAASEPRDMQGHTEADWKRRVVEVNNRGRKAENEARRLEGEVKRLENDFYAWSDGNYRDRVIKPSWDQAKEDLKKARLEADAAKAAMDDLAEEARKAGAPPGWLR